MKCPAFGVRSLKRLQSINNSIEVLQLKEDGVDCVETILMGRDKIMRKLMKFSDQCGVDINLIRFVPIEEKRGFVQAMIIIIDNYRNHAPPPVR